MAALLIVYPNEEERARARIFVKADMMKWRSLDVSITLKAHVLEHHMCDFNDEHGIGDKVEAFMELMHQVCSSNEKRTANVKNFKQQHQCIASRNNITLSYGVQDKIL